jgi:hypothetical protein
MNDTQKERLLELAEDLETGDLEFDEFDFNRYKQFMACGTVGCAIGHYAKRSPDWVFDDRRNPVLVENVDLRPHADPMGDTSDHFGLPYGMGVAIFSTAYQLRGDFEKAPYHQKQWEDLGFKYDKTADDVQPEDVAKLIRKAITLYEEQPEHFNTNPEEISE